MENAAGNGKGLRMTDMVRRDMEVAEVVEEECNRQDIVAKEDPSGHSQQGINS